MSSVAGRPPISADRPEVTERMRLSADEIDQLGHLNQARYHDLLGAARHLLLTRASDGVSDDGSFVVAHIELDYLHEVRLADGYVDVHAQIARVGRKSVQIDNELIRPDGKVAARGLAVMVAWEPAGRRSRLISDAERAVYGG
jgi:acyl-CoA thioesterase FadM